MRRILAILTLFTALAFISISWHRAETKKDVNGIPRIGEKAINLEYESPDGKMLALEDLRGYVVLLDFWASWCGPCRRANPHVVELYEKYKGEKFIKGTTGFEVYSVSLDKDKSRWTSAIAQDKLGWQNHVSDLKGWSCEGAAKYGVRAIPTTFLIDEEGYIIGINLSPAAIELELQKRIKNQK